MIEWIRRNSETVLSSNAPACSNFATYLAKMTDLASRLALRALRPSNFLLLSCALLAFVLSSPAEAYAELTGVNFKACAVVEIPYVYPDDKRRSQVNGVAIDYLDRLQDNLQFTFDMQIWNDSFDKLVSHLSVCNPTSSGADACKCDLGVGPFTITEERIDKVTFVWAFGHENYHMVTAKSKLEVDDNNTWFVFKTFSNGVWILVTIGVFMHAFGTVYYGPFRPPQESVPHERGVISARAAKLFWQIRRFPAAIMYAYLHLIGSPFGDPGQGTPSIHKSAWLVLGLTCGLFLITIYQASLTVLLFESTKVSPFKTIQDVTTCGIPADRIAMVASSASQEFWNFAVNTTTFRRLCGWQRAGITVRDLEEGFEYVRDEKADFFFDLEASVLFRAHLDCDLYEPVGEPFFSTSVGFIMPKTVNQTIVDVLSRETRLLREADEFVSAPVVANRNACPEIVEATVTVGKLKVFFIMYAIAWAVLLGSRLVFLWRRKRRMQDELGHHGAESPPIGVVNSGLPSMQSSLHSISAVAVVAGGSGSQSLEESKGSTEDSVGRDAFP